MRRALVIMAAAVLVLLARTVASAQTAPREPGQSGLDTLVSRTSFPVVWMGGASEPDHGYLDLMANYGPAMSESGARVLKVFANDLVYGNAAEIKRILDFCHHNGTKLAAEGYLVSAFSRSEISEGESLPGIIDAVVRRLHNLNGKLDYFESDETLFRAHTVYKHSISDIAANAAHNAQTLRDAFPDIQIADIEPFPQNLTELRTFLQAFAQDAHHPFDIFNPDVAWNSEQGYPRWLNSLSELAKMVRNLHMQLAVIYNGNDRLSRNPVEWITLAEQRIAMVETDPNIAEAHAIIQTWDKYPTKIGPATEPGTMLNLTTVYSSLVRLYRSGYLGGGSPTIAMVNAPTSIALGANGRALLSGIRIADRGNGHALNSRVALVVIAGNGALDTGTPDNLPTLVQGSRIKVLAGTISDVNNAVRQLTLSGATAGAPVDVELFGAKGNLDRKQLVVGGAHPSNR